MTIKALNENIVTFLAFIICDIVFYMLQTYCICSLSDVNGSLTVQRTANKRLLLTVQSKYKALTAFKHVKMFNLFLISILVPNVIGFLEMYFLKQAGIMSFN